MGERGKMIKNIVRWILVIFATSLAVGSLPTAVRPPIWVNSSFRLYLALLVGESGLWVAIGPVCVGLIAVMVGRGHRGIASATIGFCAVSVALLMKPTVQAVRAGREVPGQLAAAFGNVPMPGRAFSIEGVLAPEPEAVEIETIAYSGWLKLDFYRAVGRSAAPCVVAIHGGAWREGTRREKLPVRDLYFWLARHGYAVASIDYRLVPWAIWPAQKQDVLAAVAFLRAKETELGIDGRDIVLLGRSAGGQLAEVVAYGAHDPGIRGVVALYAPADLGESWRSTNPADAFPQREILEGFLGGTPATARAAYDSASGALLVGPGAPPTLLIHGELDTLVPIDQSRIMAEKLAAAGVPHALISLPWATHGFEFVNFDSPGGQITAYAVRWFLEAVTR
jgi:acetyl esterase/lipase